VTEKTTQLTDIIAQDLDEFTSEISTDTKVAIDHSLREVQSRAAQGDSSSVLSSTLQSGLQALASGLGIEQEGDDAALGDGGGEDGSDAHGSMGGTSQQSQQSYEEAIVYVFQFRPYVQR
jgi:hypothetical protein